MGPEALRIFKAVNWLSLGRTEKYSVTAETYYTIGEALRQKGDNAVALKAFCRSETLREDLCRNTIMEMESLVRQQSRQAHIYKRIHQVYFEKENWTKSLEAARKALKFSEMSLGSHEETVQSHLDVGKVFQRLDKNERALEEYRKAFEMQEKVTEQLEAQQKSAAAAAAIPDTAVEKQVLGRHHDIAELYRKIGLAFSELKDYLGAQKAYCKSQEICRELGLQPNEAQCWYGLALAHFNSGNFVESLEALKQCLKMYEELGERAQQKSAAAAAALPDTAVEKQVLGRHHDIAELYQKIGLAFSELKNYLGAQKAYSKSRDICKELGLQQNEAQCWYGLGLALFKSGNFVESLEALKQCLKMYKGLGEREEQISDCQDWVERAEGQVKTLNDSLRAHIQAKKMRDQSLIIHKDTDNQDRVPRESIDKESDTAEKTPSRQHFVENKSWYWGPMSRQESQAFLKNFGKNGDFLIRESESRKSDCVVSVKASDRIQHFRTKRREDGYWKIGDDRCDRLSSVSLLILTLVVKGVPLNKPFQYEPQDAETTSESNGIKAEASQTEKQEVFIIKHGHCPQMRGELLLERGDEVNVHEMSPSGWWRGQLKGNFGWFPAICVLDYIEGNWRFPFQEKGESRGIEITSEPNGIKAEESQTEKPEVFVAKYGYYPQMRGELLLERGDEVTVNEMNPSGWWRGELEGNFGWFPATFLMDFTEDTEGTEKTYADNESTELEGIRTGVSRTEKHTGEKFVVKYGHCAENSNELDLERGEEVTVLEKNPGGWWRGKVVEDSGWFPSSCVTPSDVN